MLFKPDNLSSILHKVTYMAFNRTRNDFSRSWQIPSKMLHNWPIHVNLLRPSFPGPGEDDVLPAHAQRRAQVVLAVARVADQADTHAALALQQIHVLPQRIALAKVLEAEIKREGGKEGREGSLLGGQGCNACFIWFIILAWSIRLAAK